MGIATNAPQAKYVGLLNSTTASSNESMVASFKTPALEEVVAETGGCSAFLTDVHGLLLGSLKNSS